MKKGKEKKRDINLLIILLIVLFAINYPFLDEFLKNLFTESETAHIERIIDGDTVEAENRNESIRLLGINTPERGEFLYLEAKEFLESMVLNKTVVLKFGKDRYDKYDRTLAYVFLDNKNVNQELVEKGFANYYFPSGRDIYYKDFLNAWKICIENNVNLCEKSDDVCSECIKIKNSNTITNTCSFSCDINGWKIKAEGRNNTVFSDEIFGRGEEISFELPLASTGDTIFLWDSKGKLVLWGIIKKLHYVTLNTKKTIIFYR